MNDNFDNAQAQALHARAGGAAALAACAGGGGYDGMAAAPPPPPPPPATATEASRFLDQASLGASLAQADRVASIGYAAWIDEQLALPAVRVEAHDRQRLEQLCRYITRPPSRPRRAGGPAPRQAQTARRTVCASRRARALRGRGLQG